VYSDSYDLWGLYTSVPAILKHHFVPNLRTTKEFHILHPLEQALQIVDTISIMVCEINTRIPHCPANFLDN